PLPPRARAHCTARLSDGGRRLSRCARRLPGAAPARGSRDGCRGPRGGARRAAQLVQRPRRWPGRALRDRAGLPAERSRRAAALGLARASRLAIETVGCDWSSTFVWDTRREAFRLAANAGWNPEVRTELAQLEFPADSLPVIAALRPGEVLEMPDVRTQSLVPLELARRMEASSSCSVPIARGDDIVAVLVNGWRTRTGPMSPK